MKAKKGIMVGYAMQTKGYRVWIPEEEKVIETCNVSFIESVNGEAVLGLNNKSEYSPLITEESESETVIGEGDEIPCQNLTWIRKAVPRPDGTRVDIYYGFEGRSLRLRSYCDVEKYCRAHNIKFNKNFFNFSGKDKYSGPVPKRESSTNKDKWFVAMKEEINIMSERCVWVLVPRPEKEKVIENSRTKHIGTRLTFGGVKRLTEASGLKKSRVRSFLSGYLPGWIEEPFTIYKRYPTNPPTCVLQDLFGKEIAGWFYVEELQKINKSSNDFWAIEKIIRMKGRGSSRQLLVKWVGFDDLFNSWIKAEWLKT
ncbi:chromo domain-containing protein [Trichonephila clavipes]|nr:chromo domain-containing protein [Trichonephila clavipes]